MLLQRALQCFLYKMLHFKIIQGEEQFHRMMENPLDEALKTPMLWNWRHGCTGGFDLLGVSRECEKLPTWSSCRAGSLKKQYFLSASIHQQPLKIWSCCLFDELHGPPLLCSLQLPVLWRNTWTSCSRTSNSQRKDGRNQKWLLTIPTARSMPPLNSS